MNKVTQEQITKIMRNSDISVNTIYGKCTIVTCKLPNGFIIVESSACVDVSNYDEKMGKDICMKRIENKVWELEGYMLQDRVYHKQGIFIELECAHKRLHTYMKFETGRTHGICLDCKEDIILD